MKNFYKFVIFALLAIVLFVPFYSVTVVPEWELLFVSKDSTPTSIVTIDQIWKNHSLEWGPGENSDLGLQTNSEGYIKLPVRRIRVSIFQLVGSRIRDAIMDINPHASFGPSSYVVCKGNYKCVVSYKENNEKPQRFMLW